MRQKFFIVKTQANESVVLFFLCVDFLLHNKDFLAGR